MFVHATYAFRSDIRFDLSKLYFNVKHATSFLRTGGVNIHILVTHVCLKLSCFPHKYSGNGEYSLF